MTFWVSVPVLSVQTMEAFAMVLQEPRIRTRSSSAVICFVVKARVTARGRPSGTAATTNVTEMISIWVKAMPFSLAVLRNQVRADIETMRTNDYRAGSPVPNCMKKQIVREVNRVKPAIQPILVISSARLFSFSCNRVGSGSPWRAAKRAKIVSVQKLGENVKVCAHHDTTVETLLTDSYDNILAITFEDLGARNHETIRVCVGGIKSMTIDTLTFGLLPEGNALVVGNLFDGIRLSSCARSIALDVVTGNEDTIAGDDLTGLEEGNVTNKQFLDVVDAFNTKANNIDTPLLPLVVENVELLLLLPIIEGTDHDL